MAGEVGDGAEYGQEGLHMNNVISVAYCAGNCNVFARAAGTRWRRGWEAGGTRVGYLVVPELGT